MSASNEKIEDLDGEVAVVTGAASGIGRALAEHCAELGMGVALADVEAPALDEALEGLTSARHAIAVHTDVRSQDSMDALRAAAREQLGPVDVLVSCAGVGGGLGMSWELPEQVWSWVLETNLMGTVHAVRSFVPGMVGRDRGVVINVSSIGGLLALPASAPYSVSKFGIVALTEALAEELKMRGSKVTASVACLGEVRTRIAEDMRNWPADLGPPPPQPEDPELRKLGADVAAAIESGRDPREVAVEITRQAAAGRLWVHTHLDQTREAIVERTAAITA